MGGNDVNKKKEIKMLKLVSRIAMVSIFASAMSVVGLAEDHAAAPAAPADHAAADDHAAAPAADAHKDMKGGEHKDAKKGPAKKAKKGKM